MREDAPDYRRPRGAGVRSLPWRAPAWQFPGAALAVTLAEWREAFRQAAALEAGRRRPILWLPVLMGIGILLYFAADREPWLWAPVTATGMMAALAVAVRRWRSAMLICVALGAIFAGFSAATWRTASVAAPFLDRPRIGQLTGFVETVEARDAGARLIILVTGIAGVEEQHRPKRVRVNIRAGTVAPGDHIAAVARLMPPPGPARPGGYDFGRDAFFHGLGAVGSIAGKVTLTPPPWPVPWELRFSVMIDQARNALTQRIAGVAGGQSGAMAAALVTGKRGLITESSNIDLRAAGIYHIISISGLHMVLAAGTIFGLTRGLLTLSQTIALRLPVKKLAALAAMFGALAYCVFSGSEVATVRSLIMTLTMLGAILVDRPALNMRNLALSAIIVLLREPEALLGPSFQMSFGAVAALIAFAERWEEKRGRRAPVNLPWLLRTIWTAAVGVTVTTLLATTATAPFGAYHFQTFNPFGLIGNALALPFVSLIVMPAAVFGVLAYPFGLDWPAWALMGLACDYVLRLAHWVAGFDHSALVIPAFGGQALLGFAIALVWVTLWTTRLRFLAVLPLAASVMIAAKPQRPDVLIERDGSGILARGADGRLVLAGEPSRFVLQQWLNAEGDGRGRDDPSLRQGAACDALGCVIHDKEGRSIVFTRSRFAVAEDCRRADLVVTPLHWDGPCAARLIDRSSLARGGATALMASGGGWSTQSSEAGDARRPWTRVTAARTGTASAAGEPAVEVSPVLEAQGERLQ